MTDIVAFLKARIDEDEAAARAADPGPWEVGPSFGARDTSVYVREEGSLMDWVGSTYVPSVFTSQVSNKTRFRQNATHVALHDPARVLAEVEAKRRIVVACEMEEHHCEQSGDQYGAFLTPPDLLGMVAVAYSWHPDFDPEWLPGLYPTVGEP